jgi:hypothetical protein
VSSSLDFYKNVKVINSLIDGELFITEIEQLLVIWDSKSSYGNKQKKMLGWHCAINILKIIFSFYKFSCATMPA